MLRTVNVPHSRVHHAALLEDEESIQASLMEVVNGLLRGTIELKRAELILRALNTAVRNIRRVKFGLHQSEMVTRSPTTPINPRPTSTSHTNPPPHPAVPPPAKKSPAPEKPTWPHTLAAPTKFPQPIVQQPHPTPPPQTGSTTRPHPT